MKILFHISSLYGGGAERVMSYLINHRVDLGDDVTVVVCYEHEGEYYINPKARKIVIGESNILNQSVKLHQVIENVNPDLSIGFMQGGNIRMSFANLFSRRKYILSVRNEPTREYPTKIAQSFVKIIFERAAGMVFQTPDAQTFFSKRIKEKSTVIFNPINKDFFADIKSPKCKNIVTFGRLVEQKNFKLLINAYSRVCNQIEDDLYIYGEGPLKKELEEQIGVLGLIQRVHLMGRTNDVKHILANSKLFVMSSDFEGMPNSLLEAVCMLTPSISTDCPCGGSKIILSEGAGALVEMNDIDALAIQIKKVCLDEEIRMNMVSCAKKSREKFETESILNEWDSFFALVVER